MRSIIFAVTHFDGVNMVHVKTVTELGNSGSDLAARRQGRNE